MVVFGSYENWRKEDFRVLNIEESTLKPPQELVDNWNFYEGRCSEEVREKYFVKMYYEKVLKDLNPFRIYNCLDNKIILERKSMPIRFILSSWLDIYFENESDIKFEYAFLDDDIRLDIRTYLEELMNDKKENIFHEEKVADEIWFDENGKKLYFTPRPLNRQRELVGQVKIY